MGKDNQTKSSLIISYKLAIASVVLTGLVLINLQPTTQSTSGGNDNNAFDEIVLRDRVVIPYIGDDFDESMTDEKTDENRKLFDLSLLMITKATRVLFQQILAPNFSKTDLVIARELGSFSRSLELELANINEHVLSKLSNSEKELKKERIRITLQSIANMIDDSDLDDKRTKSIEHMLPVSDDFVYYLDVFTDSLARIGTDRSIDLENMTISGIKLPKIIGQYGDLLKRAKLERVVKEIKRILMEVKLDTE